MNPSRQLRDLVALSIVVDPIFSQNCYVLQRRDTDDVIVFDPGLQHARTIEILEKENARCSQILITHGHPDHVNGVPAVKDAFSCDAAIHPDDRFLLEKQAIVCEKDIHPGDVIRWNDIDIAVFHTPGHTPGSVCFLIGPDLIAGDTLFRRGVGRTDLPGGSWDSLIFSIENTLFALPPDTVVYPGHGDKTTIGEEMTGNPFVTHPRFR